MHRATPLACAAVVLLTLILGSGAGCENRKTEPRIVLLGDQRPLTNAEYEGALAAWAQGKKAFDEREVYLKSNALDPALYIPGQGWSEVVTNPFREFLSKQPSRMRSDQLRLHTESFTGYSLYHLEYTWDLKGKLPAPEIVPVEAFDSQFRGRPIDPTTYEVFESIREKMPAKYLPRVPRVMGEIGWEVDGHILNLDTIPYMDAMAMMYRVGLLDWIKKRVASGRPVTVLEVGSGYGGFPYLFAKAFPQVGYWGCDLAEVVGVAGMYLSVSLPDQWKGIYPDCGPCSGSGMFLIANHRFEEFAKQGRKVDLVINMMSLSEMPDAQVKYYGRKISELIGDEGVFFEANFDETSRGWANPKNQMPAFFKAKEDLGFSFKKGITHLWANNPEVLADIKAEQPLDYGEIQANYWPAGLASIFLIGLLTYRFIRRKPRQAIEK